ncbi:MAG TPA: RNA-binding protein [Melioribacteraceae bacterium]|nr:RNA-binding protein [Melioribacteraceae bacterium]
MNIFVGNLAKEAEEMDLEGLFKKYGEVRTVKIIRDMFSGESKGFAFVEMKDKTAAQTAINELNTYDLKGKKLVVNEARPKTDNRRGGGGRPGGQNRGRGNRGGGGYSGGGRGW